MLSTANESSKAILATMASQWPSISVNMKARHALRHIRAKFAPFRHFSRRRVFWRDHARAALKPAKASVAVFATATAMCAAVAGFQNTRARFCEFAISLALFAS